MHDQIGKIEFLTRFVVRRGIINTNSNTKRSLEKMNNQIKTILIEFQNDQS